MKASKILLSITALILILMASLVNGEMYKWVDGQGVIHIENAPPVNLPKSGNLQTEKYHDNFQPVSKPARKLDAPVSRTNVNKKFTPKVEIYGTSWCSYCRKAREYFRSKNIPFSDYDIEKDKNALRRKREVDPEKGVPTVVINGQVVNGYSTEAYEELLNKKR